MAIQARRHPGFATGSSQDLLMENARGFNDLCFLQKPQRQDHELLHVIPFLPKSMDDHHSTSLSQSISSHIENQRIEIDLLVNSQTQRLRMALLEQRRHQTAQFMNKYEPKIQYLIKQKDEEIAKAANRNMELQDHVNRMEIEKQTWQRLAKENEAMVESLSSTIQRLRETAPDAAEDAESCCLEERERETWDQETRKMVCRCCNSRNSCVIMLPCRHLCSCNNCEAFLQACPVCNGVKKASIQVLV